MMFYSDYISDEQLIKAVQNSSHLDKCYIGLCQKTWTNKPHKNLNLNLLNGISSYAKNTEVIFIESKEAGLIDNVTPAISEAFCRNHILDIARQNKYDFMFIQDTDEFMIKEDYESIINDHIPNMKKYNYDSSGIRCKNFWKSWNYIIPSEISNVPTHDGEWTNFGIDLHSDIKFTKNREHTSKNKCGVLQDWFLFHASFIMTDDQVKEKLNTWGHSSDMNYDTWYQEKWLDWTPETTDLHPSTRPEIWKQAVPYDGPLPKECY